MNEFVINLALTLGSIFLFFLSLYIICELIYYSYRFIVIFRQFTEINGILKENKLLRGILAISYHSMRLSYLTNVRMQFTVKDEYYEVGYNRENFKEGLD